MDNAAIARILREIADLLEIKDDNPFKIRAYRNGADIVSNHPHEMAALDATGLREIPGIGKDLAARIREIVDTGDAEFHRELIAEAGWEDAFSHGTGHGVGLLIHEDPRVGRQSTAMLTAGHVVTVEPGVYLPDHGGVRIEDTVLVTADGCRTLTLAPKAPTPPAPAPTA